MARPAIGSRRFRLGRAALVAGCGSFLLVLVSAARSTGLSSGLDRRLFPAAFCFQLPVHITDKHEALPRLSARSPPQSSLGFELVLPALGLSAAALLRARPRLQRHALEDEGKVGKAEVNGEMTEQDIEGLERKMVLSAEKGNFKEAAEYRDQLDPLQLDDEGGVLAANANFYEAFGKRDLLEMEKCWYKVAFAHCIHPYDEDGHHTGYTDICKSFDKIFKESKMQTQLNCDNVKVNVRGGTAVLTCLERLTGKDSRTTLRTSHIFRKNAENRWKLLHRHASKPPGETASAEGEDEVFKEQLQRVMRAAQNLGTSVVIRTGPIYGNDVHEEDHGPLGLSGDIRSLPAEGVHDDELDDDDDPDLDDDEMYVEEQEQAMYDAREALRGLRKLEKEGVLKREEKVLLMAEMVDNPRENMAERAYSLLLRDVDPTEEEAAWQDFGDLIALQVKRGKSKSPARKRQDSKEEKDSR